MIDPATQYILREDEALQEFFGKVKALAKSAFGKDIKTLVSSVKSKSMSKVEGSLYNVPDMSLTKIKLASGSKLKKFSHNYNKAKNKMRAKGNESKEALAIGLALTATAQDKEIEEVIKDVGEKRFHPMNTLMLIISLIFLMKAAILEIGAQAPGADYYVDYASAHGAFIVVAFLILIKSIINVAKKQDAKWFFAII